MKKVKIVGIEMFRKILDVANAEDNVGLLIANLKRNDVSRGYILYR